MLGAAAGAEGGVEGEAAGALIGGALLVRGFGVVTGKEGSSR